MLGPDDDITRFEYLKKSARNFGSVLIGIETKTGRQLCASSPTGWMQPASPSVTSPADEALSEFLI